LRTAPTHLPTGITATTPDGNACALRNVSALRSTTSENIDPPRPTIAGLNFSQSVIAHLEALRPRAFQSVEEQHSRPQRADKAEDLGGQGVPARTRMATCGFGRVERIWQGSSCSLPSSAPKGRPSQLVRPRGHRARQPVPPAPITGRCERSRAYAYQVSEASSGRSRRGKYRPRLVNHSRSCGG
jgi:hypothetical protein